MSYIETKTIPVLVFDEKPVLPGSRIHLVTSSQFFKDCYTVSQEQYNCEVGLLFRTPMTSEIKSAGVFGYFRNVTFVDDENITFDLEIEKRLELVEFGSAASADNPNVNCQTANVNIYNDDSENLSPEDDAVFMYIRKKAKKFQNHIFKDPLAVQQYINIDNRKSLLCDLIAANLTTIQVDIYDFLSDFNFTSRLNKLAKLLAQVEKLLELDIQVEEKVQEELQKEQKEYYLRKKIKIIQEDLGDIDKASADADELREKIKSAGMHETAEKQALKELKRYQSTISNSPESTIIRNYLDTLLALPWQIRTEDNTDIDAVKAKLDETHSGLDKPKERILDYLAVKLYSQRTPQTILCLVGPPGTGKTTIAKSIAEALGRKFVKQSLGGVKDEAEIRGHRRTYLGALPGRIINGIKEAGSKNPVFLLDEIDKLGADYKGDPSASLLEVLDPAQNEHFMDHYLELEFDLSEVMFICTANDLYSIPGPLRDRMEIIELSSYTRLEKFKIAREHAINKSLEKNGLEPEKFEITDEALNELIRYYTREAGARQLERCLDTVVRRSIKKIMSEKVAKVVVDSALLKEMLGKRKYDYDVVEKEDLVGVVNGLAYTDFGGDVLQIEAVANYPRDDKETGKYTITGNLGNVMKESADAAYNWIMSHKDLFDFTKTQANSELHIHCPEGATPKDGPSAGVTFVTAMLSAITNTPVKHNVGMTGEITLRGRILPIGGLKEKSIAAYTAGLDTIFIPKENERDVEELPEEIKNNLTIIPVSHIEELISQVMTKNLLEAETYGQA